MRHRGLAAAMLLAAIALVYHGVLEHDFVDFDDFIHIVHNPNLDAELGSESVRSAFTTSYGITANWVPLSALSLHLERTVFGPGPAAHHIGNVVLHAASTLLLFFALAAMTGSTWRSAFVAGVFALHPLQVESVAWASERKGVLCGFFWMASLCAYASYARRPGITTRYAAVAICVSAALLSKPMAVTLPFVLLLLDYWPLRRLGVRDGSALPGSAELGRALLEKLPLFVLAAIASAITLEVQVAAGATGFGSGLSFGARLANALESYVIYLFDFILPTRLAVFYPHPYRAGVDSIWPAVGAALGIAAVSVGAAAGLRRYAFASVGWFWFLGTLVPVIGLVTVGFAARADRYLYEPIVGLALLVVWGAAEIAGPERRRRIAMSCLGVALLCALALTSWFQLRHWRGTIPLFEHAISVTQGNFIAHDRLATAKLFGGRGEESEAHYRESIRFGPPRAAVHAALADVLADSGRLDEAVLEYAEALRIQPDNERYHTKIGFALLLGGRAAEARPHLTRAAEAIGPSTELHVGLAMTATATGELGEAIAHYRAALELNPKLLGSADKLAWILATSEDVRWLDAAEAVRLAESVTAARRNDRTLDTLAAAYAAAGRFDDAIVVAREAATLASGADPERAAAIRERMAFYENGRPFIDWNSRAIH